MNRIHILRIPARIQAFVKTAQDQRRARDCRQPFPALIRRGIHLNLDSFVISGKRGGPGSNSAGFHNHHASPELQIFFFAFKGCNKISRQRVLQAQIVDSPVDLFQLVSVGQLLYHVSQARFIKLRFLFDGVPAYLLRLWEACLYAGFPCFVLRRHDHEALRFCRHQLAIGFAGVKGEAPDGGHGGSGRHRIGNKDLPHHLLQAREDQRLLPAFKKRRCL